MPGIVPDVGEAHMLLVVLGKAPAESLVLRLYVNDYTPALDSALPDFVEMSSHGYMPRTIPPEAWAVTAAVSGLNTPARASGTRQTFTFGAGAPPVDVYGHYVTGATSGTLWWAQQWDAPVTVANAGDAINVDPVLGLRTGYPEPVGR